jgi:FolB domain-containing protein
LDKKLDQIHIRDLLLRTIIGINPDERANRQDTVINLTLYTDISGAEQSDHIGDAIDYRSVTKAVIAHVEASSYNLVETLAISIARLILSEFPVERVRVGVEKPGALRFVRTVGIEIERDRADFA